jgi:hypothetical protein
MKKRREEGILQLKYKDKRHKREQQLKSLEAAASSTSPPCKKKGVYRKCLPMLSKVSGKTFCSITPKLNERGPLQLFDHQHRRRPSHWLMPFILFVGNQFAT